MSNKAGNTHASSALTAGSLHYLCLQATREGQASHAHVREIINGLEHHNWQVRLFEPKYSSFDKLPGPLGRLLGFLRAQWQLWRSSRPDILYIRAHLAAWPSALWAYIIGLPVVQEVNGPYEDLFIAWPWTRKAARLFILLIRSQLRWASAIIAVTPQLAEWARKEAGHSKVFVVPNGANTNLFHPEARTSIELPHPYVVFFGALARWQGIKTLLEAVKTKEWPSEVRLVVAGDGTERPHIEKAAGYGQVVYLGLVPYQEMPGIVAGSLAGLSPQIDVSGRAITGLLPLKVLETLACGVPVIVTDWPGQADLVRKNRCGLVIPPDDPKALAEAVAYLYYHPEERIAMGERGRKLVEAEYSWDRCAQMTSEILAALTRKGPKGIKYRSHG
ncbi:MAG: glycosyltransferase family 4 protein [Candidatus Methanomethylicaceae archaeon]